MRRPWQVWSAFALCLSVVLIVMAWGTSAVMELERTNKDIQTLATQEQTLRLALWRMDSAITPLIIEESARPYSEYNAFNTITIAQSEEPNPSPQQKMQPSALLGNRQSAVNLYFNTDVANNEATEQQILSPQVPNQPNKENQYWINNNGLIQDQIVTNRSKLAALNSSINAKDLFSNWSEMSSKKKNRAPDQKVNNQTKSPHPSSQQGSGQSDLQLAQVQQETRNVLEYSQRKKTASKAQKRIRQSKNDYYDNMNIRQQAASITNEKKEQPSNEIKEGSMQVIWIDDLLILGRKVKINNKDTIQGAWLNWDNIKNELLNDIKDLYPEAKLIPVKNGDEAGNESRMMAVLPAMIIPGRPATTPILTPSLYRIPIIIGWLFTVVAITAVGLLLFGAVSLSERRGAFVSAVTHELRTPLTTLRIYTEMLAEGMVRENKKEEYLSTLNIESKRLGNLVENVLAYAKLERGRGARTMENISVASILDRICPRLTARAEDVEMQLVTDIHEQVGTVILFTDVMAVDQILFNLVDNSAKYSANADDKRIHLAITCKQDKVIFRVCDHGEGLKASEVKKAFKPFRKSAEKAANTAPGVGLGLALCRRVTRQLGGTIDYENHASYGACFTLTLPKAL